MSSPKKPNAPEPNPNERILIDDQEPIDLDRTLTEDEADELAGPASVSRRQ